MKGLSCVYLLGLFVMGCGQKPQPAPVAEQPAARSVHALSSASVASPPSAASSTGSLPSAPVVNRATPGPFPEDSLEQRSFREVYVGSMASPIRYVWTLHADASVAHVRLVWQEDEGEPQLREEDGGLKDSSRHDQWFHDRGQADYRGKAVSSTGKNIRYRLVHETPNGAFTSPQRAPLPASFDLSCNRELVPVLAPGAVLAITMTRDRPIERRWQPSSRSMTKALRCFPVGIDEDTSNRERPTSAFYLVFRHLAFTEGLVFAPATSASAGVEWVHVNSGDLVQEGVYRWMLPPR